MREYKQVPVDVARMIATNGNKDIVIIACWDHEHGQLHTTTYGRAPADKESAAKGGEIVAKALGSDMSRATMFEDFRETHDAAKYAALKEAAIKFLPEIKDMASQILSKPDNFFARLAAALEQGL